MDTKTRRLPQLPPALACAVLAILFLSVPGTAIAAPMPQTQQRPPNGPTLPGGSMIQMATGIIRLTITDQNEGMLDAEPSVTITSSGTHERIIVPPRQLGDTWEFRNVPPGDQYIVRVDADGYQPQEQYVSLANVDGAVGRATFRLRKLQTGTTQGEAGHFLLAPRAQKEVQQALKDLRKHKAKSALKHLNRALKMAPGDPTVNYLVGVGYLQSRQVDQAVPFLEKAVSIDPSDVEALVTLGAVRYQRGDNAGAIDLLAKAVTAAPERWKAQWMLASAYLREHKYAEARDHAEKALKEGKDKAQRARLVLGEALAELGNRSEAAASLEMFLKENPSDPNAARVREWVKELRQPPPVAKPVAAVAARTPPPAPPPAAAPLPAPPSAAATEPAPVEDWLPPDVDAVHPSIVTGAACPLSQVLKKARKGTAAFLTDLQSFSAREEFQSAAINRLGKVNFFYERKFHYLLFVQRTGRHRLTIQEMRNRHLALPNMGGPVIESGAAALALVFHPDYQGDFEWNCEGVGTWRGKPAWVLHFAQRPDRPVSELAGFVTNEHDYPLALKGRAWLDRKSGRVLHLDADLMKPIKQVRLEREHFSIDYREVAFSSHPVKLWLPEDVNIYVEYHGHGYHQYHHFSHFQLFWVGTGQRISRPKAAKETKKQ